MRKSWLFLITIKQHKFQYKWFCPFLFKTKWRCNISIVLVKRCENIPNSWEKIIFVRKFCKEMCCSLENLHSWKIFCTTNGRNGRDKFQVCVSHIKATFIIQRVAKANNTFKSPSPGRSRSIPLMCPQLGRPPGTISHQGLRKQYEARLEICQKIYTINFRAKESYTLQTCKLWQLGPMPPRRRT